jgi:hypothetical protein
MPAERIKKSGKCNKQEKLSFNQKEVSENLLIL